MAEQTFKSAGFFDFETEISRQTSAAKGVPLAIIGTAEKGPAFTPVYFGMPEGASLPGDQLQNFTAKFGSIRPDQFGPYALKAWFEQGASFQGVSKTVQYVRVLGAGANNTSTDYEATGQYGYVKNAGFKVNHPNLDFAGKSGGNYSGTSADHSVTHGGQHAAAGTVFFLAARHNVSANADVALPHFTDNDSFRGLYDSSGGPASDSVHIVRAMIFTPTGSAVLLADFEDQKIETAASRGKGIGAGIFAQGADGLPSGSISTITSTAFKIVVSSSDGTAFGNDDSNAGVKIYTASLDPDNESYIANVLNTDPYQMANKGHYLYIDWPILSTVASVDTAADSICILSGSSNDAGVGLSSADGVSATLLNQFQNLFGRFDTRYSTPRTPYMISQPFGDVEHDLFYFESLSDGDCNDKYKISIQNLRASVDPVNPYGTFDVVLRGFDDSDTNQTVLERYSGVSLNPDADNYIGKAIGDVKETYNFDASVEARRFTSSGANRLKSNRIRVIVSEAVKSRIVPEEALPFGFRGIPVLKTSPSVREVSSFTAAEGGVISMGDNPRLAPVTTGSVGDFLDKNGAKLAFTGSILPPLPFRFKCAKGDALQASPNFIGEANGNVFADSRLYWGVQFEEQRSALKPWSAGTAPSWSSGYNRTVEAYTKFQGISKLQTLYTGSSADSFNNNKFTLARVALVNQLSNTGALQNITGSAADHMRDAAYIRNGSVNASDYTIYDRVLEANRVSLATLLSKDKKKFNKFAGYSKFNTIFYGGFDGLNIFDRDAYEMNDKATSTEAGGLAVSSLTGGTGVTGSNNGDLMGAGIDNNAINSYRAAVDILNDDYKSIHHILTIPGIREPLITDYAARKTEDYQMAIFIMDIPNYDEDATRLFITDSTVPSVVQTVNKFELRGLDNSYSATYFPDVIIDDEINGNRRTEVPASVAAVSAYSFSDSSKGGSVWFAPAGFGRGSLSKVTNTAVRLTTLDRDELYEARINPIANFPSNPATPSFVEYKIWGQKTIQARASALDRVNVRRMLLEVKRQILGIARRLLFQRNNPQIRTRFINALSPRLSFIQLNQGIEAFRIIMDDSNNTLRDQQNYRLNGKVIIVPTRTIEFVSIDFIIDPDGVTFQ